MRRDVFAVCKNTSSNYRLLGMGIGPPWAYLSYPMLKSRSCYKVHFGWSPLKPNSKQHRRIFLKITILKVKSKEPKNYVKSSYKNPGQTSPTRTSISSGIISNIIITLHVATATHTYIHARPGEGSCEALSSYKYTLPEH